MILQIPVILFSLLVDRVCGDPKTPLHPVALLGRFIGWWGKPEVYPVRWQRVSGIAGWTLTVLVFTAPFLLVELFCPWYLYLVLAPFLLKICFAWKALEEHARAVETALSEDEQKFHASMLVSRDTSALSPEQVLSAAYESVAENLNDSIIAPLFWYAILGLPGAALYRAINTMDAMLGYRDERRYLGWWAARMDDLFSFVPARICGVLLVIIYTGKGRLKPAWEVFERDRKKRPGYNGGIPMALIAGGEGIQFEKPGKYTIGTATRSLAEAGHSIIKTLRIATLLFCLFTSIALVLLNGAANIYGI